MKKPLVTLKSIKKSVLVTRAHGNRMLFRVTGSSGDITYSLENKVSNGGHGWGGQSFVTNKRAVELINDLIDVEPITISAWTS